MRRNLPPGGDERSEDERGYGFFQPIDFIRAEAGIVAEPVEVKPLDVAVVADGSGEKRRKEDKAAAHGAEASSIRVSIEKVDQLINLVGELVITQAMLAQRSEQRSTRAGRAACSPAWPT